MQVVTSENIQQLIQTRKVDEFKPPVAPVAPEAAAAAKTEVKAEEKLRDANGQFVKADAEKAADVTTDKEAAKPAVDDEEQEDKDLPERVRKQIGKKHRRMMEAEETAKEWWSQKTAAEQRAEKAESELAALKTPKSAPGEPDPEKYKTNAEYIDAMVEFRFAQKEAKEKANRIKDAQDRAQSEFIDRLNAVRKEIPDYDEVVSEAEFDVVPHVAAYIAESELGPKLGYHFAKNPDELARIQKLSPIRAIAELGKIEIKLETKAAPAKADETKAAVAVSKAPSPVTTLASESKTVVQKDPSKMTLQELRAYDREQREAKARR